MSAITRRNFLKLSVGAAAGALLTGCGRKPTDDEALLKQYQVTPPLEKLFCGLSFFPDRSGLGNLVSQENLLENPFLLIGQQPNGINVLGQYACCGPEFIPDPLTGNPIAVTVRDTPTTREKLLRGNVEYIERVLYNGQAFKPPINPIALITAPDGHNFFVIGYRDNNPEEKVLLLVERPRKKHNEKPVVHETRFDPKRHAMTFVRPYGQNYDLTAVVLEINRMTTFNKFVEPIHINKIPRGENPQSTTIKFELPDGVETRLASMPWVSMYGAHAIAIPMITKTGRNDHTGNNMRPVLHIRDAFPVIKVPPITITPENFGVQPNNKNTFTTEGNTHLLPWYVIEPIGSLPFKATKDTWVIALHNKKIGNGDKWFGIVTNDGKKRQFVPLHIPESIRKLEGYELIVNDNRLSIVVPDNDGKRNKEIAYLPDEELRLLVAKEQLPDGHNYLGYWRIEY